MNDGCQGVFEERGERSNDTGENGAHAHHAPLLGIFGDVVFAGASRSLDDAARQPAGGGADHTSDASLRGETMDYGDRELARVGIWALEGNHLLYASQKRPQQAHTED